ncbi:MAG TPA: ABC transporter ATP-binding protein [Candidatus Aveggerthella stercoripullorum]|uniref:ABC transporter ATP-binding protein n=1 Tax=Candidatus Aveggerthella stercoripullorum TaxID=2840688 RepID=A0A9D1D571_9ACTN|nr:ABC transporter ATP-binding protein [Candidatus Aveggerthella stercoripullorum]
MIELKNVTFTYAGASCPSVEGFDLTIEQGECVLLAGPSGCGKTTVSRLVNGLAPLFYEGRLEGDVLVGGKPVTAYSAAQLARTVGSVFQDPRSQFFTTDTTSEIAFSCENMGLPRDEILDRVALSAVDLGATDLLERSVFELSSGERQRVAIASACALAPDVLVFDEPSANLDSASTAQLGEIVAHLKRVGKTIVVAEHRLHYLRDVVDRVVIMGDGKKVAETTMNDLRSASEDDIACLGLRSLYPERLSVPDVRRAAKGAPLLEARGLRFAYRRRGPYVLDGIDLSICPSEIVAVVGGNGAGKSTLASVLCGLRKQTGGEVLVSGRSCSTKERRRLASFVMQDADYQLFAESVEEELKLGIEEDADVDARVEEACSAFDLMEIANRHPASLSGGQKQRVVIAAAIAKGAKLVFFDEPTSGLDGANMKRTAEAVERLALGGRAIFVITHDFEFIASCCTRIVRIEEGVVVRDVVVSGDRAAEVREAFFG